MQLYQQFRPCDDDIFNIYVLERFASCFCFNEICDAVPLITECFRNTEIKNIFLSTLDYSTSYEKSNNTRSKVKVGFLENLNAKLAEQRLSGKAFAVRNLINSKALVSEYCKIDLFF